MGKETSDANSAAKTKASAGESPASRKQLRQGALPRHTLREALTVAQAITDNFAGDGTAPHQVAMALGISPTSSAWRTLTGAAVGYGLTDSGYRSDKITLSELGVRATAPTEEGDDLRARAEAALRPTIFNRFFTKYNRAKMPVDHIAKNVLRQEFGVPTALLDDALTTIKDNGTFVGFIHQTKTGPFISTDELEPSPVTLPSTQAQEGEGGRTGELSTEPPAGVPQAPTTPSTPFRIFISHGKNLALVEQVKDVLDLYDIDCEVAVEEESTAIPVPQKVLSAMRRCSAAVMVVAADDDAAAAAGSINTNVLIEIGAAFVLYDQRVVLLWDKRLKVPSNLQGLYRCEFEGNELSFATGTKLAKAVKGFRSPT
jgi:hypothetical protein